MIKKRLCVLQVTPEEPNKDHVELFKDKEHSDFYFVTHDKENKDAIKFCPNTTWVETRNILAELVPKEYEYYAFIDYDYVLRPQRGKNALDQICEDLQDFEPAVLTYYPGKGLITPFAENKEYYNSADHSVIPFTHCGLKIVHHSLMSWFFPMVTRFGGGVDACHLFNILEIPFLRHVVCSHKMLYDNGVTDLETPHNQNGAWSKYRMDEMWAWIMPAFKKSKILGDGSNQQELRDSLHIKNTFINLVLTKGLKPKMMQKQDNYLDTQSIENFFDLSHERFVNINLEVEEKMAPLKDDSYSTAREHLESLTFEDFKKTNNPWFEITNDINNKISGKKLEVNECVDIYHKLEDNKSLFHNECIVNQDLYNYLDGKSVAFVGPAPRLNGQGKGKEIDSHDVVVRIQHGIPNEKDFGTRTDIIQSCLNTNYGPPLVSHLNDISKEERPKFIIANDTVSHQLPNGQWAYIDQIYENVFRSLSVPFVHLKNEDGTWDRWALYWQVYPKQHIENFNNKEFQRHSANFNSGYGALNHLLRYPLTKLSVYGLDFYNTGIPQNDQGKYNKLYTDTYGVSGTPFGPDHILHDQLSQMMHCKNVLMKDDRFKLDEDVVDMLYSEEVTSRIDLFSRLPKFKHETR